MQDPAHPGRMRTLEVLEAGKEEGPRSDVHLSFPELRGCAHARLEALGSGGGTSYHRCLACGTVLMIRAGRVWALPAEDE